MAYNYLNKVGLDNLWGNIKNYITSKLSSYATKTENSLKANDNTVVHLTGDETIAGNKAFSNSLTKTGSGNWGNILTLKNTGTIKSTAPDNNTVNNAIRFASSDYTGTYSTTEAEIVVQKLTTGENRFSLAISSNPNTSASGMANLLLYSNKKASWNGDFTADNFYGNLVGNATSATSATNDSDGNSINTTYAKNTDLALVATSGAYSDLSGKPSIPTVNDAVLTIKQNGANARTFSANASANVTVDIAVPTKVSELTNDSGYITGVSWDNVSGKPSTFTPKAHTHAKSDITDFPTLATVATSGSYTDLSNKPTIPTVNNATLTIQKNGTTVKTFTANASSNVTANITVPTKTSQLSNDTNYATTTNVANSLQEAKNYTATAVANCVHTTGNETIDGNKSFSKTIHRTADITTSAAEEVYKFTDTNATPCGSIYNRMYWVNNKVYNRHHAYNATSGKDMYVEVLSDNNGSGVINTGGSITDNRNLTTVTSGTGSTYVATMGWVNNPETSTNVVHRSGDESITDKKCFDSPNNIISLVKRITDYATEDKPTTNVYQHLAFQDKNNKNLALVQYASRTSNVRDLDLYVFDASGSSYGIQIKTNNEVTPNINNVCSLGSTSNKWANVYATTYYGNLVGGLILNQTSLKMTVKDSNSNTTRTNDVLCANSSNSVYGLNVALGGSGNTIVGAGESYTAQLNELEGNNDENLYLMADASIYFKTGANTFANAKTVTLSPTAELSGLAKVTSTSFVGTLTGDCYGGFGSFSSITTSAANFLRCTYGSYGSFWRHDGSNLYLMLTASGDQNGTATSARPIVVNLSNGICNINGNAATATRADALTIGGVGASVTYFYLDSTANPITNNDSWSDRGIPYGIVARARAISFSYTPTVGAIYSGSYLTSSLYGSGSMTNTVSKDSIGGGSYMFNVSQEMSASVSSTRISNSQKFLCTTANTCTCTVTCAQVSYTTTGTFTVTGTPSISGSKSSFMRVQ